LITVSPFETFLPNIPSVCHCRPGISIKITVPCTVKSWWTYINRFRWIIKKQLLSFLAFKELDFQKHCNLFSAQVLYPMPSLQISLHTWTVDWLLYHRAIPYYHSKGNHIFHSHIYLSGHCSLHYNRSSQTHWIGASHRQAHSHISVLNCSTSIRSWAA